MSTAALERQVDGLAFVRRLIAGELGDVPIGELLRFRAAEAEHGRVTVIGAPDRRVYNLIGTVHGGWAAAILDTAMGLAVLSQLPVGRAFTTLDLKVNYLRPVTDVTGEVRAEGRVLNAGKRIALCEGRLTDRDGKLMAHGTSTCLIVATPAAD